MSTIKSSAENLTLNADGANNDIIFQSNGSNVATLDQAGLLTATTFAGSGASLTALNATNLASGTVPTARLGSGTANNTVHLRGDGTWAAAGGGKLLQMVYTQSISASGNIATTSGSYQASGIQLSITPEETGSDIIVEFTCSHMDVRGGNSARLIAKMYVGGSAWSGAGADQICTVGHDHTDETHVTLSWSQRTTGTAGTAIAFEPYFYSNTGSNVTLVAINSSYMLKAYEIGA